MTPTAHLTSYPSIYNIGHKATADLLRGPCLVEEKVDGSQISFGLVPELAIRSKGATIIPDAPDKMFKLGVEAVTARAADLHPGWTYRGEYLRAPKHGALAYDRIPKNHVILFDINPSEEAYLSYEEKVAEAARLDFECVPLLHEGAVDNVEEFRRFLDTTSTLGGQKIEGVVVKPVGYDLFGRDKKCLMGKFVSEAYKEVHKPTWSKSNPTSGDVLLKLGAAYGTPTRWWKAVHHLRDAGMIEGDVRDIGMLMKEIPADIQKECEEELKEALFAWAWPHVRRMATRGVPEWYKQLLLMEAFAGGQEVKDNGSSEA